MFQLDLAENERAVLRMLLQAREDELERRIDRTMRADFATTGRAIQERMQPHLDEACEEVAIVRRCAEKLATAKLADAKTSGQWPVIGLCCRPLTIDRCFFFRR